MTSASPPASANNPDPAVEGPLEPPVRRPPLGLFLKYCYHFSLPAEYHTWVLHDVTCRTWWLRHFGRWFMVIIPFFAIYMTFMPTTFATRLYTGLAFSGAILMFAIVNIMIDTDRRAVRAGYSHSHPQHVRTARAVAHQREASYQRRERIAERQARRRK